MVAAHDVAHGPIGLGQEASAAVPADVVVSADVLIVIADDDDRIVADVDGDEIAGLWHLGGCCCEDPRRGEHGVDVAAEELLGEVERGIQTVPGPTLVDEPVEVVRVVCPGIDFRCQSHRCHRLAAIAVAVAAVVAAVIA